MDKIGFVVLHYMLIEDTIQCIESIQKRIDTKNYCIVIVDNASPNNTGVRLMDTYSMSSEVTVLLNMKNEGFARGNNVGIQYAREVLHCKYVVVLNNDTYLIQDDFYKVITEEYEYSHFAILGPRIDSPNEYEICNPMRFEPYNRDEIAKLKKRLVCLIILNYLGLENTFFSLKKWFEAKFYKQRDIRRKAKWKKEYKILKAKQYKRHENVQLNGCCFVLSDLFFEVFQGLDTRTFMYFEEAILYEQMIKTKLLTVYNPKLRIYHKESASTDAVYKTKRKIRKFTYKNCLASLKILAQYVD